MKYDEVWSYSIDRISEYFVRCEAEKNRIPDKDSSTKNEWSDGRNDAEGICQEIRGFILDGVHIQLFSMPTRKVGQLSFPQTRVVMKPESNTKSNKIFDENVERVHHAFYLNFLSGGA